MRSFPLLLLLVLACGSHASSPDEHVEKESYIEQTPNGPRRIVITKTTRVVEAPPPPPRPADPLPDDPLVRYNLDRLNAYRHQHGLGPLLYDAKISTFATSGSKELSQDHTAHAHFAAHAKESPVFGSRSAENQGDPRGVPALADDHVASGKKQIDLLLKLMMDEGPGGGHYENIVNPKYRRIGIGFYFDGQRMYLTNDFSD